MCFAFFFCIINDNQRYQMTNITIDLKVFIKETAYDYDKLHLQLRYFQIFLGVRQYHTLGIL